MFSQSDYYYEINDNTREGPIMLKDAEMVMGLFPTPKGNESRPCLHRVAETRVR